MSVRTYIRQDPSRHHFNIAVVFEGYVLICLQSGIRCVIGSGCLNGFKAVSMVVDNVVGSQKKPVH